MTERFLVTGAYGCVGAWVVHELVRAGREVVTFDLSTDARRLRLLLGEEAKAVPHAVGDIADGASLEHALDEHGITKVIHLAALQVPLVRADPPLGARVNVLGTVNVFEAAKRRELAPVVFASSIAALDREGGTAGPPSTLYGVFKRANEHTARNYFEESGVSSVGLRPHTVYGVGRDQGVTSAPTAAMLAAAAGVPYTIPYGGTCQMHFARDVARAFVAASDAGATGAETHNLPGRPTAIADVVAAIGSDAIGFEDAPLPFPDEPDTTSFRALVPDFEETPLEEGVRMTIERFRALLNEGVLTAP
ncbi:MAG TPA: NAD(P)-dependent oxidoreductase [Gaiellaceae bacterium]|nr:NAD(P)-dependent oxidoreductase [Gaiellaceae bacterium]